MPKRAGAGRLAEIFGKKLPNTGERKISGVAEKAVAFVGSHGSVAMII